MDLNFYLAQITAVLAWVILIISYWKNKDDKILYLQVISCIFFALNYVFLGAYTGLLVVIFEIVRDCLYIKFKDDRKIFFSTLSIYFLIFVFGFEDFLSLFSIFASFFSGYSLIYKGRKVLIFGIISYVLWLIYDFYCFSYMNVLAGVILIVSNMVILIRGNSLNNSKKGIVDIRR